MLLLSFLVVRPAHDVANIVIAALIGIFLALNGRPFTAVKALAFYLVLVMVFQGDAFSDAHPIVSIVLVVFLMVKMFYLPFLAGSFLISTSDVSSMIVSMEKIKFPRVIVIPIAVVFRYFPAIRQDQANIKMAMKMRGIRFTNPVTYLEYVMVPMLMAAVNVADDISKAAETKCIADPCKKTRYVDVRFQWIDPVFVVPIVALCIVGRAYA